MQVQVSPFLTYPLSGMLSAPMEAAREKQLPLQESGNLALSDLSQVILHQGWGEAQFSAQSSTLAYRRDGSLALSIQSRTSFTTRRQEVMVEIRLPASILGEGVELKEPLTLEIEARDEQLRLQTSRQVSLVKPTRRVEEILFDILRSVQEAFTDKDVKSLRLVFDEEALSALSGDEKLRKLIQELLSMLQVIQALRQEEPSAKALTVYISGKGKPYWQVNEEQTVEIEETRVYLRFVFQSTESV